MNNPNSLARITVEICTKALWAPALVFVLHREAANWLGHEPYVDPVMHFSGGFAIAFLFWRSATCFGRDISYRWVIGLTTCVALAWELMEFCLAVYRGWSQYWDLANTARDLVLGIIGAGVFIAVLIYRQSRSRQLTEE